MIGHKGPSDRTGKLTAGGPPPEGGYVFNEATGCHGQAELTRVFPWLVRHAGNLRLHMAPIWRPRRIFRRLAGHAKHVLGGGGAMIAAPAGAQSARRSWRSPVASTGCVHNA